MFKIAAIDAIRRIEAAADAAGLTYDQLMENAGRALAQFIAAGPAWRSGKVTFLIGPGSNGSDGLVAARLLAEHPDTAERLQIACYLLKRRPADDPHYAAAKAAGIFLANAEDDQRYRVLINLIASSQLVVDALYGIGVRLPLGDEAVKLLRAVRTGLAEAESERVPPLSSDPTRRTTSNPAVRVLAVDCPSGVNCDTGAVDPHTLPADSTLTFIAAKPGLLTFPAADFVGRLHLAPLDVPPRLPELAAERWSLADGQTVSDWLPPRPLNAHKGTFGTVGIIGGSAQYVGAVALSISAAIASGAGLVQAAVPAPLVSLLAPQIWEATWLPLPHADSALTPDALPALEPLLTRADALAIGMGLGRDPRTGDLLRDLLARPGLPPLVLDADALTLYAELANPPPLPASTVITPHPGELGRLLGVSAADVNADRWTIARRAAARFGCVVLLKGAHTLIAAPDDSAIVLPFKTPRLARAGAGDVLSGVIAGLLGQRLEPFKAAVCGAFLHGEAGERLPLSAPLSELVTLLERE